MIKNFHEVLNFNRFICNSQPVLPIHHRMWSCREERLKSLLRPPMNSAFQVWLLELDIAIFVIRNYRWLEETIVPTRSNGRNTDVGSWSEQRRWVSSRGPTFVDRIGVCANRVRGLGALESERATVKTGSSIVKQNPKDFVGPEASTIVITVVVVVVVVCTRWKLLQKQQQIQNKAATALQDPGNEQGELTASITLEPVEVQEFRKITHHLRRICGIFLNFIKKNWKIVTTCNQLDLETLGSWPIMPRNLLGHCMWVSFGFPTSNRVDLHDETEGRQTHFCEL